MRVVKTGDFLKKSRGEIEHIIQETNEGEENYTLVANERYVDRSYIIINPHFLVKLLNGIGLNKEGTNILDTLNLVAVKVSDAYRRRNPYWKGDK